MWNTTIMVEAKDFGEQTCGIAESLAEVLLAVLQSVSINEAVASLIWSLAPDACMLVDHRHINVQYLLLLLLDQDS